MMRLIFKEVVSSRTASMYILSFELRSASRASLIKEGELTACGIGDFLYVEYPGWLSESGMEDYRRTTQIR